MRAVCLGVVLGLVLVLMLATPAVRASPVLLVGEGTERSRISHVLFAAGGSGTTVTLVTDYRGPKEPFAVVFVVPQDVSRTELGVTSASLVERVVRLGAPRFREYWQSPTCDEAGSRNERPEKGEVRMDRASLTKAPSESLGSADAGGSDRVAVDRAEYRDPFVGEFPALQEWMNSHGFALKDEVRGTFREYERSGVHFAALRVAVEDMVFFSDNGALLTPIQFRTRSELRRVWARLGQSSSGTHHDLYIHALYPRRSLQPVNFPWQAAPTNWIVSPRVRDRMGETWNALFDESTDDMPGGFLLEYAWRAHGCAEPCPDEPLTGGDLRKLGAGADSDWVLSRLHRRGRAGSLEDDPELRPGVAIRGGWGTPKGKAALLPATREGGRTPAFVSRLVGLQYWKRALNEDSRDADSSPGAMRSRGNSGDGCWGGPPREPPGGQPIFIAEHMTYKSRDHVEPARVVWSRDPALGLNDHPEPVFRSRPGRGLVCSAAPVSSRPGGSPLWWSALLGPAWLLRRRRQLRNTTASLELQHP